MQKRNPGGIQRLINATGYSVAGLKAAWRNEAAFRQEVLLTLVMSPIALWIGDTMQQRALLIGSLLLVIMIELINSAIEAAIDRIGPERHALSGRAKNLGSAAVLVALINAGLIWAFIAWESVF